MSYSYIPSQGITAASSCTEIVIEHSNKITLTEIDSPEIIQENSLWCFKTRNRRNVCRVLLAGGLSTAGGCLAGLHPTNTGIAIGGSLAGVGNGASTWLAWEKKREFLIEARMLSDFNLLVSKVKKIDDCTQYLFNQIKISNDFEIEEVGEKQLETKPSDIDFSNQPWYSRTRYRRNVTRLLVAGALSASGGWLGGFAPTMLGVLAGSAIGGIGNAVSTWLAFESSHEKTIRKAALDLLPEMVKTADACEMDLKILIEQIQAINPERIIKLSLSPQMLSKKEASEDKKSCVMKTRARRNFVYVNTAGWLSAVGGWVSGWIPNAAGILVGGAAGAAANSISTWLAWEKENDEEIERVALKDFPQMARALQKVQRQIEQLKIQMDCKKNPS